MTNPNTQASASRRVSGSYHRCSRRLPAPLLAVAVVLWLATAAAAAPVVEEPCDALVKQAVARMIEEQYREALAYVERAFNKSTPPSDCRAYCQQTRSCAYLVMGKRDRAVEVLVDMLREDPRAPYNGDRFPPGMNQLYRDVRDSVLTELGSAGTLDIRTLAVLDFEVHNWVGHKYQDYDVDALGSALQMIVATDLVEGSNLVVVDRTNMKDVLSELELTSSSELVDKSNALRLGQLLNAHAFVDGQITFVEKDYLRIDVQVVHAATTRVLNRHYEGPFKSGRELMKLQRGVVALVVEALNEFRNEVQDAPTIDMDDRYFDQLEETSRDSKKMMDIWLLKGEALAMEDQGDVGAATKRWEEILKIDADNELARSRIWALGVDTGKP